MGVQLTKLIRDDDPEDVKGKCDMCGKDIYLARVSNSYIDRQGEKVTVMDVTNRDGRCMLCKIKVSDARRTISKIARIGE